MSDSLSDRQRSVLDKLTNPSEVWTVKAIAKHYSVTTRAVYNIITKLRYKGYLSGNSYNGWTLSKLGGVQSEGSQAGGGFKVNNTTTVTTNPIVTQIRVHAHQFLIKIINITNPKKYKPTGNKSTLFETHRVKCHKNSIEIYCHNHWKGFTADSEDEADKLANEYWLGYMREIERSMGVLIVKQGSHNILRVKAHYAHIKNGIAYYYKHNVKQRLQLRGQDGKEWLIADFSHGVNELEFTHSQQAKQDSQALKPHLEAMREKNSFTVKDLSTLLVEHSKLTIDNQNFMLEIQKQNALSIQLILKFLTPKTELNEETILKKADYIG